MPVTRIATVPVATVNQIAISVLPRGPRGATGASGSELQFATRTEAIATTISGGSVFLRTAGYAAAGDGGGGLYKKVISEPAHAGKLQSADGAWWELVEFSPSPRQFGAVADGSTDDTTALQNAIDAHPDGCRIRLDGTFKANFEDLDWNYPTPFQMEVDGGIVTSSASKKIVVPNYVDLIGTGGSLGASFSAGPQCKATGQIRVDGGTRKLIKGQHVISWGGSHTERNAAIELYGKDGGTVGGLIGALAEVVNVSCDANDGPGDTTCLPFLANSYFWSFGRDCSFVGRPGAYPASMLFTDEGDNSGSYNGLHTWERTRVNAYGVKVLQKLGATALSSRFYFHQFERENAEADTAMFDFENHAASAPITLIQITRPGEYDATGDVAYLNINSRPFTVTIASPGVFTATRHGLLSGTPITLSTSGALPTGLAEYTTYYVIATGLTADTFRLSATLGGSAINTSGSQSGTHYFHGKGAVLTVDISGHNPNIPLFLPHSRMPSRIIENGRLVEFDYGTLFKGGPTPNVHYSKQHGGALDTRLVHAPTAPQVLPFTPLAVLAAGSLSGTAAGGATVTTGVLRDDGTTGAVQIEGTNGGFVRPYSSSQSFAVGDYLFICCKMRATEADLLPCVPVITLSGVVGYAFENGSNSYSLGGTYEPRREDGKGWFSIVEAVRIATVGASPTTILFNFNRLTAFSITAYDMWGLGIIPASAGMTDGTIAKLARSLTPWPNVGAAGRVALPTHQHLQLSMAWNAGHIIDEAGNHLWMNAGKLYTKSSAPSSGTDGTVVGTQT